MAKRSGGSATASGWTFVGRRRELDQLRKVLDRGRWFFVKISGRRRIGKTSLIRQAMGETSRKVFYVQIPDSDETGVLTAVRDAMDVFEVPVETYARPRSMHDWAGIIESMIEDGYAVIIDEFQYFNRMGLRPFCSSLQAAVDRLASRSGEINGGLIVLGSIHADMMAVLDDRSSPLYNRITDPIELTHLDVASLLEIIDARTDGSLERLLMLWNLFEGVPKYYRDAYEQDVINADREDLIRQMYFESSSPLRGEADNWFLQELKGRNDMILKYIARRPGQNKAELEHSIAELTGDSSKDVSGYLTALVEKYRLVERRQPIFASKGARRGRYYVTDNFLQSWLSSLKSLVEARQFRPTETLVLEASERLKTAEGFALEKLVRTIYQERSRSKVPGFQLSEAITGYWDRAGIEIDLVACDKPSRTLRMATCKRDAGKLTADVPNFLNHVDRFIDATPKYQDWNIERFAITPELTSKQRIRLERQGVTPQDLPELVEPLRAPSSQSTLF